MLYYNLYRKRIGGRDNDLNIYNKKLETCSIYPITGWKRDGKCRTDSNDKGLHTICAKVNDKFLKYTKNKGNDLSTPIGDFPGLKSGDNWCLCVDRYKEAYNDDIKIPIKKKATNLKSLYYLK